MEVNHKGEVSGSPKGKQIFMGNTDLVGLDGGKLSSEEKNKAWQKNAEAANGIKSDEENQKLIDEVIEYNASLKNVDDKYSKVKLNGNAIMVRLYKHSPVRRVGTMFVPNELVVPYQTEGGKYATQKSPLQYIHKGVIYNISDSCSEQFKTKFKVGDVVDLKMGINLMQQRTWLEIEEYYNGDFDNHFLLNENMIEKGSY